MHRSDIVHPSVMFLAFVGCATFAGCAKSDSEGTSSASAPTPAETEDIVLPEAPPLPETPRGLEVLGTPAPDDNPNTPEKVALGELLFFDTRLSDSGAFACSTCHLPRKGWTDGEKLSRKFDGELNTRHSPTLYNVGYALDWYWDGRKKTLEDQILAAWKGQVGATPETIVTKLARVPAYRVRFERSFGAGPSAEGVTKALASFLRVKLRAGESHWDRYQEGNESAVSKEAVAGYALFVGKARCAVCHGAPLFSDMAYHNVGIGYGEGQTPDPGRFAVTNNEAETGAFKTPSLRGVELSAPYFHDGSVATLEEAVDYMLAGGNREGNPHIDPRLQPVELSAEERQQLIAFLKALTPAQTYEPPTLP